ncbi:MAG: hypothetical protein AB7E05_15720 [Sphingobium sp.]
MPRPCFRGKFSLLCLGALLGSAAAPAAPHSASAEDYLFLVFSNPAAGMEDIYQKWYSDTHLPDVVSVAGFVSAQRFELADVQLRLPDRLVPRYLALYRVRTDDLRGVREAMSRSARCGRIGASAAMGPDVQMYTFKLMGRAQAGTRETARPGQRDYIQIVLGDATHGQDAAFNRWYDQVHQPQLLQVPGFIEGQRGIAGPATLAPQYGTSRYLALFRIRTADLREVFDRTKGLDVPPPSFDRSRTYGYTFRAIGPELSGAAARLRQDRGASDVRCDPHP